MAYRIHSRDRRRYFGDDDQMRVHDLVKERSLCQIDELLATNRAMGFDPDSLEQAQRDGYASCPHCVSGRRA